MSSHEVKQSGGKIVPHSDLRAGTTLRGPLVKSSLRIGTWNVRTMKKKGKLENLKREMRKNKINILGLSEVRWEGEGQVDSDEFRIIYSGGNSGQRGVGIAMKKSIADCVIKVITTNDRLMAVKLHAAPVDILVIQVYMPTSSHEEEEIEEMYELINEIYEEEGTGRVNCIIMGDWNSIVGEGEEGNIIGKYGLGKRNSRGDRLVEFCSNNNLVITNTWFKNHRRRLYTWKSPGDRMRCQMDYILVKYRFRNSIQNAKTLPGADIDSDHNLLVADISTKLKKIQKTRNNRIEWDLEKLKLKQEEFRTNLEKSIGKLQEDNGSVDTEWREIRDTIKETMNTMIGKRKREIRKPWITAEMIDKMEERRKWKNVNSEEGRASYRKLNNELRRATDKAKEKWLNEQCEDMQRLEKLGRYDRVYARAKELDCRKTKAITGKGIRNSQGISVTEPEDVKTVWEEYVKELYDEPNRPIDIPIENEYDIEEDNLGPSIIKSEVVKAIRELKNGKAKGIDEIPAEAIKAIGPNGINTLTSFINRVYDTGEWPQDFLEVTMIPLRKKLNAMQCQDYRTISILSHASKIIMKILHRRLEKKYEEMLGNSQFGFRKGKGTRDAIGVMRTISERSIEYDKACYVGFIDWQKAFDRVDWRKLMTILKEIGMDWKDRRLIRNLYMNQRIRVRLDQGETKGIAIGRGVRQGCCLSPVLFNIYAEKMMEKALEGMGNLKIGGKVITSIKYADDQAILASSQEELQRMINSISRRGREYGMTINIEKTKVMNISRNGGDMRIRVNGQNLEQVEKYRYLGSIISCNGMCTEDVRDRIGKAKMAFNNKKNLLTSKLSIELRRKLVKCYVWSIALYGAETWTLRKSDTKYLESFEMWTWRKMQKIKWTDKVRNEEALRRIGESRSILQTIRKRKANWIGHSLRHESMIKEVIEGKLDGKKGKGRKRFQIVDELKGKNSYQAMKRDAEDRDTWRNRY